MLPAHVVSTRPIAGSLVLPAGKQGGMLYDFEMGGIAIQDASKGLEYQLWICWYTRAGEIRCKPYGQAGNGTLLYTEAGVRRLSFSFDRNMQPVVTWETATTVKLRWFDSVSAGFVVSEFPGVRTPRLVHDDKRYIAFATSDVLFCYLKDDKLYIRETRDRYTVEYVFATGLPRATRLANVGMSNRLRVQFEIR